MLATAARPPATKKIDNRRGIAEVAIMGVTNKISRSQAFEHAQRLATTNSGRRLVAMPTSHLSVADRFHQRFGSEIWQPCCDLLAISWRLFDN